MSIVKSIDSLNTNLLDLEKILSELFQSLEPILIPESSGVPHKDSLVSLSSESPLSQDIGKYATIIKDINDRCTNLISRIDIK